MYLGGENRIYLLLLFVCFEHEQKWRKRRDGYFVGEKGTNAAGGGGIKSNEWLMSN